MSENGCTMDKEKKTSSLTSRRQNERLTKFASHMFLIMVGITMAAPFLWMLSTALKPEGQVSRPTWMPIREFVRVDGEEREVVKRVRAKDGAGLYRVRVISRGPHRGEIMTSSTDQLTHEMMHKDRFALQVEGKGAKREILSVELVEKVVPEKYEVTLEPHAGREEAECIVGEDEIITRMGPRWENFVRAWKLSGVFGRAFINSLFIAVVITIGQVLTSSLAAFAFARLQFPGRDKLFLAYLSTMMIPGAVTMIPLFVLLKAFPVILNFVFMTDWFSSQLFFVWWHASPVCEFYAGRVIGLDSYFALIAPGLFSAYGTFMLRQFFLTIESDLEDAARIDGCSSLGVYWHVIVPLSKPALATLSILTFMGAWRIFLWPMVVTSTPEMQTLPVMLQAFMGITGTQWELLMAGTLIVMGPMIIVFLIGQRFFIEGIRLGALKG